MNNIFVTFRIVYNCAPRRTYFHNGQFSNHQIFKIPVRTFGSNINFPKKFLETKIAPYEKIWYYRSTQFFTFRSNKQISNEAPPTKNNDLSPGQKNARSLLFYGFAMFIAMVGLSFNAIPLYNRFCKSVSYGGTIGDRVEASVKNLRRIPDREVTIYFNADKNAMLQWNFKPLQGEVTTVPGETVLAFFSAENPTDKPISGISTYNVVPFEVGKYFNKIQCFCFDEQRLNPHEQVDMPVFFYIDPEFATDPYMDNIKQITLSYTFFEAREGLNLPFISRN